MPNSTQQRPDGSKAEPKIYDFRQQNTLSREHVRTMQIVQETFARNFATMLASQLRSMVQVSIQTIEQHSYDEYVRDLASPNLLTLLSLSPMPGAAILQLPLEIAFSATELLLGGAGRGEHPTRPLTELELQLIRSIIERALPELRYAFEPVVVTDPRVVSQESNPQYAQIAAPTDMVIVVTYEIRIEAVAGYATLCIPFSSLQPYLEALVSTSLYGNGNQANLLESRARVASHVAETPVLVSAQFRPMQMTTDDLVQLRVGDVLPLNHPLDEPVTMVVDKTPTHHARIGRRNRRMALLIESQADPTVFRQPVKVTLAERTHSG